ncbi:hypothetical protein GC163_23975 [bacterium]|nr:hypothetical protein [bacterium]
MLRCIPGVLFTFIMLGSWMFAIEISPKSLPSVRHGQYVVTYDDSITAKEAEQALAVIREVYASDNSTLGEKQFRVRLHKGQSQPLVRFEQIDLTKVHGETELTMAAFGQMIGARTFDGQRVTVQVASASGDVQTLNVSDEALTDYFRRANE